MAAESLEQLIEQITCAVCLDEYTDPKVLVCLHVYCKTCLESLLVRSSQAGTLTCPDCRKVTQIPPNGVAGLNNAFYISRLFDIRDSLIKSVDSQAQGGGGGSMDSQGTRGNPGSNLTPPEAPKASASVVTLSEDPKAPCPEHRKNELKLFCETCREVICMECTIRVHNGHTYKLLEDVAEKEKALLRPMLDALEGPMAALAAGLNEAGRRKEEIVDLRASIEGDVHSVVKELHEMLGERESVVVAQLERITRLKLKELDLEVSVKETLHAKLSGRSRSAREALTNGSAVEFMSKREGLEKDLQEAVERYQEEGEGEEDARNVCTQADMVLDLPSNFKQRWSDFGEIVTPGSLDPQMCVAKGKGLERPHVGEAAVIYLSVNDRKGCPFMKPIARLECTYAPEDTGEGEGTDCEVLSKEMNVYQVSYVPTERGVYQVSITVASVHIQGSPFSVLATLPVESLGTSVAVLEDAAQPWGVAICEEAEEVVVSECNGHRISVFARPTGKKIRSFGSKGSEKSNMKSPRGVATDKSGNVFVVDSGNHRVQKFTSDGDFLGRAGTKGKGPNQFTEPKGAAFNGVNSRLYVTDVTRVQVLTSDLDFCYSFGRQGSGRGQFASAFGIVCDCMGRVYVTDCSNRNIQIFSSEGNYLKTFTSSSASAAMRNFAPVAVALDNSGHVYASDDAGNRVLVFSSDGKCLNAFGSEGFATGKFKNPRAIAVTRFGMVYVCDYFNNRVQAF